MTKTGSLSKVSTKTAERSHDLVTPQWHQHAPEIQKFGTVVPDLPIGLAEDKRRQVVALLNQILADTATMRDLYKKSHWQVKGPTFYQLHLLYDKHFGEQAELVDGLAERIQTLGGVAIAMAADVADTTNIPRPPKGVEEVPAQISRLLEAHRIVIEETRQAAKKAAELGDDGSNDLLVSDVLRTNEMQVWFVSEHVVDQPLVIAK
jgi:starvation-inducible DNA-binding protein